MAKARMNENGELINVETGKPIGRHSGHTTTISSTDAEHVFTLEDYGVREPEIPDEEFFERRKSKKKKEEDEDFSNAENTPINASDNVAVNQSDDSAPLQHFDVQPTSFKSKSTWMVPFSNGKFGEPKKLFDGAYHGGISEDGTLAVSGARLLRARVADSGLNVMAKGSFQGTVVNAIADNVCVLEKAGGSVA